MLHSRKQWYMYCIFFITHYKSTPNESCKVGEVFIVQSDIPKHLVRVIIIIIIFCSLVYIFSDFIGACDFHFLCITSNSCEMKKKKTVVS